MEYDHREQDVIARVEHIQDWFVTGFRLRRRACVFSLKRRQILEAPQHSCNQVKGLCALANRVELKLHLQ